MLKWAMAWKEKTATFIFENQPIDGLWFLDGRLVTKGREDSEAV
jgi:hypothetical protein